ncbi:MAG: hypothetical protein HY597_06685 [Candidatus Omnitrophica bacterium]|nr:hypothetical protein [Candidatus Omnitrophota bacterium]
MAELSDLKSRSIRLIHGYVRGVDHKPNGVKVREPYRRIAILINTHYPEFRGRGFFDHELVLKLCAAIAQGRVAQVRQEKTRQALTLKELEQQWRAGWESDDHDDPSNNSIFKVLFVSEEGDEVVAQVNGLPYWREGGPAPYNDDDTLEVFVPEAAADGVVAAIRTAASEAGAAVTELPGEPVPATERDTFISRLWKRWTRS